MTRQMTLVELTEIVDAAITEFGHKTNRLGKPYSEVLSEQLAKTANLRDEYNRNKTYPGLAAYHYEINETLTKIETGRRYASRH